MNILITLCARGGSKGIPKKNIRPINGIPLVAYSIRHAEQFSKHYNADMTLSTDSDEIKVIARKFGLETDYQRPEDLSTDTVGKIETISHVLTFEEDKRKKTYDYIVDLDISSPLRNIFDLLSAFELIQKNEEALNLFSVNAANRNPYFNMVEIKSNGFYSLVKTGDFTTRQSAPEVYDLNASFYFFRRNFFNRPNAKTISERSLIYIMPHICFDLDHVIDFDFMEYLMVNRKLGFDL